jgi:hypothetical protein
MEPCYFCRRRYQEVPKPLAKFLAIHNTAGLFSPMKKFFEHQGHMIDIAAFDHNELKFDEFYGIEYVVEGDNTIPSWAERVEKWRIQILNAVGMYDVIIVSSAAPIFIDIHKIFPDKPLIFVAHGEIKYGWSPKLRKAIADASDAFYVTTTDLMKYAGIDNNKKVRKINHAVDMEHFKPRDLGNGKVCFYPPAAYRDNNPIQEQTVRKYLKDIPDIDFQPSYQTDFENVPDMLQKYSIFYDVKFTLKAELVYNPDGDTMSRMGEEALAMGLTVIDGGFTEHKGLPDKYKAENVTMSFLNDMKEMGVI